MKQLSEILRNVEIVEIHGDSNIAIRNISFDSRAIEHGDCFIAVKGTQVDGHKFITQVIEKKASVIICENIPNGHTAESPHTTMVMVKDSQAALGIIAANYFDNPSKKLNLVGVTGTNGKTTIATLLHHLFSLLGYNTGLLSTIENKINEKILPSTHTTPDPISLNRILSEMVQHNVTHCFMEVSSHAIHQKRIAGLHFNGGIFTNLTQDHLDYHKDFQSYIYAKKTFFDALPKSAWTLTNLDDRNGMVMQQNTKALKKSYALKRPSNFKGKVIENSIEGLLLLVNEKEVWFNLSGEFNAYNLLAIYGSAILLGEDENEVLQAMSELKSAEGRFDVLNSSTGKTAIVDYAHTPDALKNVLQTINTTRSHNEQLITVVGAGGNRDSDKRPKMAKIAADLSEKVILTSDNPRNEDPEQIIDQMFSGLDAVQKRKVLCITSRRDAIKTACMMAEKGDIILVAGKGHEKYQEISGEKHHFDDKEQLNEFLQ